MANWISLSSYWDTTVLHLIFKQLSVLLVHGEVLMCQINAQQRDIFIEICTPLGVFMAEFSECFHQDW